MSQIQVSKLQIPPYATMTLLTVWMTARADGAGL